MWRIERCQKGISGGGAGRFGVSPGGDPQRLLSGSKRSSSVDLDVPGSQKNLNPMNIVQHPLFCQAN